MPKIIENRPFSEYTVSKFIYFFLDQDCLTVTLAIKHLLYLLNRVQVYSINGNIGFFHSFGAPFVVCGITEFLYQRTSNSIGAP